MEELEKQVEIKPKRNKKGQLLPGNSGNPAGRPKGQSLKEFARQYLSELSPEEKAKWLKGLSADIVWRMAEGNPHQDNKHEVEGKIVVEISETVAKKNDVTP